MAKHNIHLKEGDCLREKYEIIRQIGAGGMSAVYLAKEINSPNQLWAVKVADMEKKIARRLISEAKVLSELNHPTLPKIADFFSSEDKKYFYLVQEFVDGHSLYEEFEQEGGEYDEASVIDLGLELCDVLEYLHMQNPPVIYRDLKPANIMRTEQGVIKLIDFGIARKHHSEKIKDTLQIGTVGFAAPEQFEKRQSDTRTDLFSLGALMYFLLSGGKYVYISEKPIQEYHKGLTKTLRNCISELVKFKPDDRLQSVEEVREKLLKAKVEWEDKQSSFFHSSKWLLTKYVVSILLFFGVIIYIILDQI